MAPSFLQLRSSCKALTKTCDTVAAQDWDACHTDKNPEMKALRKVFTRGLSENIFVLLQKYVNETFCVLQRMPQHISNARIVAELLNDSTFTQTQKKTLAFAFMNWNTSQKKI